MNDRVGGLLFILVVAALIVFSVCLFTVGIEGGGEL